MKYLVPKAMDAKQLLHVLDTDCTFFFMRYKCVTVKLGVGLHSSVVYL